MHIIYSIPQKIDEDLCAASDIDRLVHYGQLYGKDAIRDSNNNINPAFFFDDDVDQNTEFCMSLYAREKSYEEFRSTGVHRLKVRTTSLTSILLSPV